MDAPTVNHTKEKKTSTLTFSPFEKKFSDSNKPKKKDIQSC